MASTIAGTPSNWTITSPAGQLSGAAINHANASLEDDGTVVIKSADGVLWAGNIMTLGGLTGATPALRYADLLNNYLTGLLSGAITIANNPGTGGELVNGTAPNYLIKRITSTGQINVTPTADTINLSLTNTIPQLSMGSGTDARVYNQVVSNYTFRRLQGGTGITVTEGVGSAPNVFSSTVAVVGATDTGENIVTGSNPTFTVKRLKAGTNVTLSSDPTSVTINATGGDNGFWVRGGTVEPLTTSRARIGAGFFNRNNGNLTWNSGASEFGQDVKGYGIQFNCQINIVTPSTGAITLYLNSNNGTLNDLTWRTFPAGYNGAMTLTWISVVNGSVGAVIPSLEIVSTVADGTYSVGPFESGFISANRFL